MFMKISFVFKLLKTLFLKFQDGSETERIFTTVETPWKGAS